MEYMYPSEELVALTVGRWDEIQGLINQGPKGEGSEIDSRERTKKAFFPGKRLVRVMLDVVYQASLRMEESRRIAVRVAYLPAGVSEKEVINLEQKPIALAAAVNFTVNEVMRLAPALDATRSMILVCPSELVLPEAEYPLAIWGIYHQGSEWWRLVTGKESGAICPPNCLTVSAFSPGNITATTLGMVIFRLKSGQLEGGDVEEMALEDLSKGRVGAYFDDAFQLLYQVACKELGRRKYSEKEDEDEYPRHRYFQTLENMTNITAGRRHGGAFIFIPDRNYLETGSVKDSLSIKYEIDVSDIWKVVVSECVARQRYFDLLYPEKGGYTCLEEMPSAAASDLQSLMGWKRKKESAGEEIAEFASFVSSLSSVDGAVVLTRQFQVVGFGAEIRVDYLGQRDVRIAKDRFGNEYYERPVSAYGTRHRSAFRLCSSFEDCLCLVVSQDGAVRIVKGVKGDTYVWDDVHTVRYGL